MVLIRCNQNLKTIYKSSSSKYFWCGFASKKRNITFYHPNNNAHTITTFIVSMILIPEIWSMHCSNIVAILSSIFNNSGLIFIFKTDLEKVQRIKKLKFPHMEYVKQAFICKSLYWGFCCLGPKMCSPKVIPEIHFAVQ